MFKSLFIVFLLFNFVACKLNKRADVRAPDKSVYEIKCDWYIVRYYEDYINGSGHNIVIAIPDYGKSVYDPNQKMITVDGVEYYPPSAGDVEATKDKWFKGEIEHVYKLDLGNLKVDGVFDSAKLETYMKQFPIDEINQADWKAKFLFKDANKMGTPFTAAEIQKAFMDTSVGKFESGKLYSRYASLNPVSKGVNCLDFSNALFKNFKNGPGLVNMDRTIMDDLIHGFQKNIP